MSQVVSKSMEGMMTRQFMAPFVVAAVIVAAACNQGPAPAESLAEPTAAPVAVSAEDVEAAITQLERDWVAAIMKKDTATIDRLLAEEFNGTSPTAHVYPKSSAIDDLTKGIFVVDSMVLDEISVNAYGDAAVAFTSQQEKSQYDGKDTSGHYHYTDVWVKKGGQWRVVASHGSRFDKGHQQ
jgi:ketosteroid isomerase-like protein